MQIDKLHPGQFAVGSALSRAAARALIDERRSHARLAEIVLVKEAGSAPSLSEWKVCGLAPIQSKGEHNRIWINS